MNIQDALSEVTTFTEFLPITKRARAQVSSLGDRFVVVEGHIGSLQVTDLANKIKELIMRRPEWTEEIRGIGFRSCQQIDRVHLELIDLEESLQGKAKDLNQRKKDLEIDDIDYDLQKDDIDFYQQYTRNLFKSPNLRYLSNEKFEKDRGGIYLYVVREFDPDGFPSCFRNIRESDDKSLSFKSEHDSFFLEKSQIDERIQQKALRLLEIGQSESEISEGSEIAESVRSSHEDQQLQINDGIPLPDDLDDIPVGPPSRAAPELVFSKIKPREINLPEPEGGTRRFYNSKEDESYPETAYVKFSCGRYIFGNACLRAIDLRDLIFSPPVNNINYIESSKLLKNIRTFEGLGFIAKNASVKLSIFGSRIIRIKGCVDTVKLNDLKQRLIDLFIERLRGNLEEPREAMEQAVQNISDLCIEIKRLENTCNFITKIFLRIRALFS